jgi:lipopolysaccharide/colanic/teichoic acid biosynthesis glycosyltransferase
VETVGRTGGLNKRQKILKRVADVVLSAFGLFVLSPVILVGWLVATIDTRQNGFYTQTRIGKDGLPFRILKLRTMRDDPKNGSTVTTRSDNRITVSGKLLRRTKWNELPQLANVLVGDMSFVGPRPEVPGFADELEGADRIILSVRPGITGPATLLFRNEEIVLDSVEDPERYNVEHLYPEKVRLNRQYVESYSFAADMRYIALTVMAITGLPASPNGKPADVDTHQVVVMSDHVHKPVAVPELEAAQEAESA